MAVENGVPQVAGAVLALLFVLAAMRCGRRRRLVDDTPTSKTQGVFIGMVELQGTAETEAPLRSYLAGTECISYRYEIDEHWSRTVTEHYTDAKGNRQTRTRHESGWKTVASGDERQPFYLQDDTGIIRVQPEGATLEPVPVFSYTCGSGDPLYYGKGPTGGVADSDHRRRFTETAIPLHHAVYIMGHARERADIVAPEIAASPQAPMYLISTRSEKEISGSYGRFYWLWIVLGLLAAGGGVAVAEHLNACAFFTWPAQYLVAGLGYVLVVMLSWLWMAFNSIIGLRQRARQAWAQVDIQLKRRHDLIPNLAESVKGMRGHEQAIQETLAALRAQLEATPPGQPGPDVQGCAPLVQSIVERYPDLSANPTFLELQKNLVDTEQRIALARAYFNDIATFYNIRLERVPDRFVAAIAAMKPAPLMTAEGFERAAVHVNLATGAPAQAPPPPA